ncbi:MAG: acyloxyacyl hydrolase [Bacteroidota bacterium]|nr:acyloxyacyl hydrolase [Bacteroidota bacterium]
MYKTTLLFVFLTLSQCYAILGLKQREVGFISGYGYGISQNSVPEGNYQPLYFMGHFGLDLNKFVKNPFFQKAIFTLYSEPQINVVYISSWETGNTFQEYEFGINSGFKLMYPIYKGFYIAFLGGSGPHSITTHTVRQYRGFAFSDNFGYGAYLFLNKKVSFSAMFRLRHMSNLNIFTPNSGINTYNFHFGLSWWIF